MGQTKKDRDVNISLFRCSKDKRRGESKEICDLIVITFFFLRKIIICAFLSFLFPYKLRGRVVQNLISYMIGNVLTSQHYSLATCAHMHTETHVRVFFTSLCPQK